jgi:type IV secretion system protein VirB10
VSAEPPETDSELFRRLASPRSAVAHPDRPWGFVAGLGGIGLLAVFLFASLSQGRIARQQASPAARAPAPAPMIATAVPETASAPVSLRLTPALLSGPDGGVAPADGAPTGLDPPMRLRAPAMVVDLSGNPAPADAAAAPAAGAPGAATAVKASADEQFAARVSDSEVETAEATRLGNTALVAPQGTIIPAILETGINSDLPGYVRALVSRDVRGFDGSTVLVPRGSKLIGEYTSGVAAGQSRAFVVWTRLLTPDGISVDIGSPAVDPLGRGGIKGETNSHFLRRFGAAILMSVLSAGLEGAANHFARNNTAIVIGTPQQATNGASIALQRDIDVPTTITVPQGTPIRAFIARDLDFSGVMRAAAAR